MNQYTVLAKFYDRLNSEVNYKKWAEFLHNKIEQHKQNEPEILLDLACGSGNMTVELAKYNYDMIGIDLSIDMLMEAEQKSFGYDILYLNQDMRDFELYGTVDVVTCCLDSINYLLTKDDVRKCFRLVYNYLNPSGLFIFDVNTPHKFENIYADNTYVFEIEEDDIFCTWQNSYDKESHLCDFDLNIFVGYSGKYTRYQEIQTERMYTHEELEKLLSETGFDIAEIVCESDERWHFVCKSKKL